MINLKRSSWSATNNSIYISDELGSNILKIYPRILSTTVFSDGGISGALGAISPAFRDGGGVPQGISFSISGDYYEVLFSNLLINDTNQAGSSFDDVAKSLDTFFCATS
jgi:hypothetical protein